MSPTKIPTHTAIIMDGNGRWATRRGWPRLAGHRAGIDALRRAVEAAPGLGIETLSLYAFSADNWGRPQAEVDGLMRLFHLYLSNETERCIADGVRLSVIGRRDRLGPLLRAAITASEMATASGTRIHVRLAIDYSARDALLAAAASLASRGCVSREAFAAALGTAVGSPDPTPDVDLMIRSGGEQRLSDFLLWESAYAELVFTETLWPDFDASSFAEAVEQFSGRERRFGKLKDAG
ncbi:MAG: di-trans,poly-cis-decaprenylcistransferase [Acidobacteriota bacterium]